ncbi:MAG TPA: GAP family protein [Pirellulales bacterium]|jgi:hypothetical protein|nr:GAP family protein [Pirellulales bacterium]
MDQLLFKVLPLALASAVSPASLAVSLVLLGGKIRPRMKAFAYLLGGALVALAFTLFGLLLASGPSPATGPHAHAVIDAVLGSLLLALSVVALAIKPSKDGRDLSGLDSQSERRQLGTCALMGLLAMGLNVSSLVPFLAAVREVGRAVVSMEVKGIALGVAWLLLLLPMILPLVIYLIAPKAAARILTPVSIAATKYGRYLVAAICLILGSVFIWEGIKGL